VFGEPMSSTGLLIFLFLPAFLVDINAPFYQTTSFLFFAMAINADKFLPDPFWAYFGYCKC